MFDVGASLAAARETRGYSLADAERLTHIRQKHLAALERAEFDALPGRAYARAFLRTYANALGLDADRFVAAFEELVPEPEDEPIALAAPPRRHRVGIGTLVGLVGVGVLAGIHPKGGWWGVAGTMAVVVASVSYAVGSLWGQRLIAGTSGLVLSATTMIGGFVALLPLGLWQLPSHVPGWKPTGSVVALAVIGTALAQILLYRVLRTDGAARVSLVTYLLPATALVYGVLLLGEPLTWQELGGMVLILGGVALGSGALRLPRREPVAAPSP